MGMARLFDFGGTLNVYDRSVTPQQADYFAIASDWQAIGDDFRIVLGRVDHERVGGKKK
jgi:hypothetical protein